MKTHFFALCLWSFLFMQSCEVKSTITPVDLRCEYQTNPLGIDMAVPRFSWTFDANGRNQSQSAFELLVSDNEKDLKALKGNIWTTGIISTSQSIHVAYGGSPLKSFTRYFWKVRVYDKDGLPSGWSDPASFETAMLSAADWKASWIGDGQPLPVNEEDFYKDNPAPIFRKIFDTKQKIKTARLYISGLGYYEASMNGVKIGDHVLDPGWTAYRKQVLYATYDVTKQIKIGANAISVMLGNGWYNPLPLRMWGSLNLREKLTVGSPCFISELHLTYSDGSKEVITTDDTWQADASPILRNSVYIGEHYDARLEKDWGNPNEKMEELRHAVKVTGPEGILSAQLQPPIRIIQTIKPVSVSESKPGVYLFDMGQNFAGVARIRVKGDAGTRVVMRYGEDKYKDGNINVMTSVTGQIKSGRGRQGAPGIAWQEGSYILKGKGIETWSARFCFHGFRYVEVTGWPGVPTLNDIEGLCMSSDVSNASDFSSSNEMFNRLHEIIGWTFRSNIFSVQSDCPAREKFGYGGDLFCTTDAFSYNYDMANFYRKALQDNVNDQRPLGGITETAPFVGLDTNGLGDESGPLGWQIGFPYLMDHLYEFYGDRQALEENYDALVRQVAFIADCAVDHLLSADISEHESLDRKPARLTSTAFYYYHVKLLAKFANILSKTADANKYEALSEEIKQAIITNMFDADTGTFDNATQSAQIFGLWFDFVEGKDKEAAFEALMKAIENKNGHLSTGIFATKMMFDVFRILDKNDVAYRIANQRDFPGWGYMIDNGATTLWETWAYSDNTFSQNHPMFGSINEWFYRSLLGINPASPGFEKIIIKPQPTGDLTHAKGSYLSVRGRIGSAWRIDKGKFYMQVEIPVNTTAEIWIPSATGSVAESGQSIEQHPEITNVKKEGKYAVLTVGSGKYNFETDL